MLQKQTNKQTNKTKEHIHECNPIYPEIPDHSYKILITGGSGSGKNKFIV